MRLPEVFETDRLRLRRSALDNSEAVFARGESI